MNTSTKFDPLLSTAAMEVLAPGRLRRVAAACLSVLWPRREPDKGLSDSCRGFARAVLKALKNRSKSPIKANRDQDHQEWGITVARRHVAHSSYAVHQHLKLALRRHIKTRPQITIPADPFAVFLLFVVAADPGALDEQFRTRDVFSLLGKYAALGCIMAAEDWVTEADAVAVKILDSIADIQESQGNPEAAG